jgi:UDP-N-acetyl-D-glucosamine dehydrogenase
MYNYIKKKIKSKNFSVGIVGLGYVGLPLAIRYIKNNISVYGVDKDNSKVKSLRNGNNYIQSISTDYFKKHPDRVSSDYKILKKCDVIFICLPTPLKNKEPDLSYIITCGKNLKKIISTGQVIILESTVYPGVTRNFVELFVDNKLVVGKDIFIGYSPERENPGDNHFSYKTTPKVISGLTNNCLDIVDLVYKPIVVSRHKANTLEVAESSKLLENLYRAVNIALVNEFKIICDKLSINVLDVIESAATKNFGFHKFLPGPGWGGHCIPIDPFYLSWVSKKNGYNPIFIRNAGKINHGMPSWVLKKVFKYFANKNISRLKILLLGLSYKKNVDDDRESPTFEFMKILQKKKIKYDYSDPFFESIRIGRNFNKKHNSILLNKKNLKKYDCVILITDHDKFDYRYIARNSKIIFDTRGVYRNFKEKNIIFC